MKDFNSILLSRMRDIHGPVDASWWPLAPGWWIVIFLLCTFFFIVVKKILREKAYRKSWRYRIEQELDSIAADNDPAKAKENISRINNILKRLSIRFYGRRESAALNGKKWLAWLTNHDPRNFNWAKKAEILIQFPYMPEEKIKASSVQISTIAKAAKPWLRL
jgi:hypothetical protein